MLRRAFSTGLLLLALVFGQVAALAHDIGHLDPQAPVPADCDTHYVASQMGGGPLATAPTVALDLENAPATSWVRQRDASIPVRVAYLSQAPPASLR